MVTTKTNERAMMQFTKNFAPNCGDIEVGDIERKNAESTRSV